MPSCFIPKPYAKGRRGGFNPSLFSNPILLEAKVLHAIRKLFVNFRKVEMDEISFVWLP